MAGAVDVAMLVVGRVLVGIGVGLSLLSSVCCECWGLEFRSQNMSLLWCQGQCLLGKKDRHIYAAERHNENLTTSQKAQSWMIHAKALQRS